MADEGDKLAALLAKRKAARAAKSTADDAVYSGPSTPATNSRQNSYNDDDDYSGGMGNLGLGGGANGAGSFSDAHSRARSGVVEVDIRDIELEADKKAQGGLGVLYKGVWRGCEVAVKRPVDPRSAMDPELKEDFRREVDILSEVRHPNVVLLMGACQRGTNLCIVLEWCQGGSLFDVVHRRQSDLPKEQRLRLATGAMAGLAFLHSHSPPIIHRDIKSQNVLVDESLRVAKLCDFGLAVKLSDASTTNAAAGTPSYMAPELFRGEACSLPSDVYAFGVMLNEIFSREIPFGGLDVGDVKSKVGRGERPTSSLTCPRGIVQLANRCWAESRSERPQAVQVVALLRDLQGTLA